MIGPAIMKILKDLRLPGDYVTTKVKGDNKYNNADGDIITYRKKDGRRFNLSVTYNF